MNERKLILIEFNELCPSLLDKWMADGSLPNFKRFYEDSDVFITSSDVEEQEYLEPWIQWYSLHTGLRFDQHGVFRLTDGPRAPHTDIWSVLARNGLRVGNFSSMNARAFEGEGNFYLPDPWCTSERAHPAALNEFHRYISAAVRGYTEPAAGEEVPSNASFLRFLLSHGISAGTAVGLAKQITAERLSGHDVKWRRASHLDAIQFDVFSHYFQKYQPNFSTFFSNSTAHYQHAYWRYMEPEKFSQTASEEQQRAYEGAIKHGYQRMDALLARFAQFEADGAQLILASALSQQPYTAHEAGGGQRFYRPLEIRELLERIGVRAQRIQSVMTHQYSIETETASAADEAVTQLNGVSVDGDSVFDVRREAETVIYFGSHLSRQVDGGAELRLPGVDAAHRFDDFFYQIEGTKSGYHHPDGVLWCKFGKHQVHEGRVSIVDVFPTILDYFSISDPAALGSERAGNGLFPGRTGMAA